MGKKLNYREVVRMCQNGRANEARKTLIELLSASSSESNAEQKRLLDGLLYVEMYEGHAKAALQVLKRRRALGYRKLDQRMDAALEICTLLFKTDQFFEARAELSGLLRNKRSLDWHGLLSALFLYVEADEKCQGLMDPILVEASRTAIKKFGIPIPFDGLAAEVPQTIRGAHNLFRVDSKAYSQLLCRAFTETTQDGRERFLGDLYEFSESAKVEFFKNQARKLLDKLMSKNAG